MCWKGSGENRIFVDLWRVYKVVQALWKTKVPLKIKNVSILCFGNLISMNMPTEYLCSHVHCKIHNRQRNFKLLS